METKIYIITDKEKKRFKSYYVVWKHNSGVAISAHVGGLNRTM